MAEWTRLYNFPNRRNLDQINVQEVDPPAASQPKRLESPCRGAEEVDVMLYFTVTTTGISTCTGKWSDRKGGGLGITISC